MNYFLCAFLFLASFSSLAKSEEVQKESSKVASSGFVTIEKPWIPALIGAKNAAVFMVLKTPKGKKDFLIAGACPISEKVELHAHVKENGIMKMRPVEEIEIDGQKALKSGSYHIMLMGLKKPLKKGDRVDVTLTFRESGEMTVSALVEQAGVRKHTDCEHHK